MTTRTIQILGQGYNSTPASITVTLDGTTVFVGEIPTLNESAPADFIDAIMPVLCTFDLPIDFVGNKSMTCAVTEGTVVFANFRSNYTSKPNPEFSQEELDIIFSLESTMAEKIAVYSAHTTTPFSPFDLSVLESPTVSQSEKEGILHAYGIYTFISTGSEEYIELNSGADLRSNITIDGVAQSINKTSETTGTWWWTIPSGSILAYDLGIESPGLE